MRSAAVLMLATVLGLALLKMSGQPQRSADDQPQTSPPAQVEPPAEKPQFTEDYDAAIREKDRKVLLIFSADWCPHCVLLKDHLKETNLEGYLVCVVDIGSNRAARRTHSVRSLPTSIILKDGEEVSRERGFDKQSFDAWVEKNR
jgi:thiol-disulfide isomerase/thioredoxin